jgi:hypothetical protein
LKLMRTLRLISRRISWPGLCGVKVTI